MSEMTEDSVVKIFAPYNHWKWIFFKITLKGAFGVHPSEVSLVLFENKVRIFECSKLGDWEVIYIKQECQTGTNVYGWSLWCLEEW